MTYCTFTRFALYHRHSRQSKKTKMSCCPPKLNVLYRAAIVGATDFPTIMRFQYRTQRLDIIDNACGGSSPFTEILCFNRINFRRLLTSIITFINVTTIYRQNWCRGNSHHDGFFSPKSVIAESKAGFDSRYSNRSSKP